MPGAKPGRPHRRDPAPRGAADAGRRAPTAPRGRRVRRRVGRSRSSPASLLEVDAATTLATAAGHQRRHLRRDRARARPALPEISSGIAAVRLGDHQLAVADIFGGNAFQVCLFLRRRPVAGQAGAPDVGRPQRLARRPRDRADGRLRVRGDRPPETLPPPARHRLVRRPRPVRARDRRAVRHRSDLATSLEYTGDVRPDLQGHRPGGEPDGPQGDPARDRPRADRRGQDG